MTTAVATPTEQVITCTDFACLNATSHESLCDCSGCFGADHGRVHRPARDAAQAAIRARAARTGDVFLGAAASCMEDEDW